jgi:hypothetical protein
MHENREISGASRSTQDRDRSAKAQSHNADMHVSEKSDCAVLCAEQRVSSGGFKSLQRSDEERCIQKRG